ncbi:MAG: hypothetical protein ABSG99_08625 [Sedimentisphaerales bacterium]
MAEFFSERRGYNKISRDHLIYEDAPEQLREYIKKVVYEDMKKGPRFLRSVICRTLLVRENPSNWSEYPNIDDEVNNHLHEMKWYQVYDVIESLADVFETQSEKYESSMNSGFQRLGIGWQLKDGIVQTRGDEAFEEGLNIAQEKLEESRFAIARKELKEAILDLSKRPEPDLRGTIQHSIGALESVAREITGDRKKTLGEILKFHPEIVPKPLDEGLSKIWGYASEFARHVREDRDIERKEAQLILGISSTIITYLIENVEE